MYRIPKEETAGKARDLRRGFDCEEMLSQVNGEKESRERYLRKEFPRIQTGSALPLFEGECYSSFTARSSS